MNGRKRKKRRNGEERFNERKVRKNRQGYRRKEAIKES